MQKSKWTSSNIPSQKGKVILITGATSGLGKEATKVLASKDARVVMAIRNIEKAAKVVKEITSEYPEATVDILELDLTSLASIKLCADTFAAKYEKLDILINNAGIMMCPFSKTKDGFEIQMGTNHLGHFALTGHLMPVLLKTQDSRVVTTSSVAHKTGKINFEDINWESRKYSTTSAYSDSKLANLYFTYELTRKYQNNPDAPLFTSCHPGWTKTELDRHSGMAAFIGNLVAQKVPIGTLPTLRAATDPQAKQGDYFGPKKFFEMRGYPELVKSTKLAQDEAKAKQLWDLSQEMTGVVY